MSQLEQLIHWAVLLVEGLAAVLIVAAVLAAVFDLGRSLFRRRLKDETITIRLRLAERFVLALEFLIAAGILKSVTTTTLEDVAVLGGIILIRIGLGLSIDYELRRNSRRG